MRRGDLLTGIYYKDLYFYDEERDTYDTKKETGKDLCPIITLYYNYKGYTRETAEITRSIARFIRSKMNDILRIDNMDCGSEHTILPPDYKRIQVIDLIGSEIIKKAKFVDTDGVKNFHLHINVDGSEHTVKYDTIADLKLLLYSNGLKKIGASSQIEDSLANSMLINLSRFSPYSEPTVKIFISPSGLIRKITFGNFRLFTEGKTEIFNSIVKDTESYNIKWISPSQKEILFNGVVETVGESKSFDDMITILSELGVSYDYVGCKEEGFEFLIEAI